MNGNRILASEFAIAIGFIAWQDLKAKYLPWPGTVVRVCSAFAILGILGAASEEFAAALGGGFLLAGFLRFYQSKNPMPYGIPSSFISQEPPFAPLTGLGGRYTPLYFGGTTK